MTSYDVMGSTIMRNLRDNFPGTSEQHCQRQALALAEEVGEFVGAYRRWSGQARRTDSLTNVGLELADVVITAFVTASVLGIELDSFIQSKYEVILTRGWREHR